MAEGLMKHLRGFEIEAHSCGLEEFSRTNPMAIAVMAEIGVDITKQKPKLLSSVDVSGFFQIISFVDPNDLRDTTIKQPIDFWQIPPPEQDGLHPEEAIRRFRKVRDKIRARIQNLGNNQPW